MRHRLLAVLVRLIVLGVALKDVDDGAQQTLEDGPCEVHACAVGEALDRGGTRPESTCSMASGTVRGEGRGARGEGRGARGEGRGVRGEG